MARWADRMPDQQDLGQAFVSAGWFYFGGMVPGLAVRVVTGVGSVDLVRVVAFAAGGLTAAVLLFHGRRRSGAHAMRRTLFLGQLLLGIGLLPAALFALLCVAPHRIDAQVMPLRYSLPAAVPIALGVVLIVIAKARSPVPTG